MAIIDDMRTDRAEVTFTHRKQSYKIWYKPLSLDDPTKAKLDDMVTRFSQGAVGDFTGINPLMLAILADWEFDRIVRTAEDDPRGAGLPLATDGSILTDRSTQFPMLERLPITAETLPTLAVFLKLDMATAIIGDVTASLGNTKGTSSTTPPAGTSAPGVPVNSAGGMPISVPSSSTGNGSTTIPDALVTVPSLESRASIT